MREIHAINSNVLLLHLVNTNRAIASWSIFQFTGSVLGNIFLFTGVFMWSAVISNSISCLIQYKLTNKKMFNFTI